MFSFNNSANLLIGKAVSRTASVQYTDPSNATTYIANGEIVVLDEIGNVLAPGSTIANTKSIRLVQGRGTADQPLVFSARITGLNVTSFTGINGSLFPAQEQISIYGYDGVNATTALDVTATGTYTTRLTYKHDKAFWSEQKMIRSYFYDATVPTQRGLALSNAKDINNDVATLVTAEVLNSSSTTTSLAMTAQVNQGSNIVTLASAYALVKGDILRIGNNALATTDPVYEVFSIDSTQTIVTLTFAYQGASATIASGSIGTVTVTATNWGVKLTGKALRFVPGFFKYLKVMWDTTLQNFGLTSFTDVQAASKGKGSWQQVQETEWFLTGYEGAINRMMVPLDSGRQDAISGTVYSTITINYYDTSENYPVSGTHPAPQVLYVFLVSGASQNATIAAQLNPWMASLPASFNAIGAL